MLDINGWLAVNYWTNNIDKQIVQFSKLWREEFHIENNKPNQKKTEIYIYRERVKCIRVFAKSEKESSNRIKWFQLTRMFRSIKKLLVRFVSWIEINIVWSTKREESSSAKKKDKIHTKKKHGSVKSDAETWCK